MTVHNHGTEEGPGLACRETMTDAGLKGKCVLEQPGVIKRKYIAGTPEDLDYDESWINDLDSGSWQSAQLYDSGLVTSEVDDKSGRHAPVLDFDFPVAIVPSSTPGHFHVYLEREIPWAMYSKLLDVLAECGLLEPGYVRSSKRRRFTCVRLPWVRKPGS